MPLKARSKMEQKLEIVTLASSEGSNISELAERSGVCRKTVYNWLRRWELEGNEGLEERSRRPLTSPWRTPVEVEEMVLRVRAEHPAWGPRKIKRRLEDMGHRGIPSPSTVLEILRRRGMIEAEESAKHRKYERFERERPNEHWQMDFKGHFAMDVGRCHPLSVVDDHSRFLLGLEACGNERRETVRERLENIFRRYGLPEKMVVDNGPPWSSPISARHRTSLALWLIRLGIEIATIGVRHPQSNGKIERLHRSLKAEVLQGRRFRSLDECQDAFDAWRHVYNFERPHEACGMKPPSSRYSMSLRSFPDRLPEIEYAPDDQVRKVQDGGFISFRGKEYRVGKALKGQWVAVRPGKAEGEYDVYFVRQRVMRIRASVVPPRGDNRHKRNSPSSMESP